MDSQTLQLLMAVLLGLVVGAVITWIASRGMQVSAVETAVLRAQSESQINLSQLRERSNGLEASLNKDAASLYKNMFEGLSLHSNNAVFLLLNKAQPPKPLGAPSGNPRSHTPQARRRVPLMSLAVSLSAALPVAAWANYAECVLDTLPGTSNYAVHTTKIKACRTKHPEVYRGILHGSGRGWFSFKNADQCIIKKASNTPYQPSAAVIAAACRCLYDEGPTDRQGNRFHYCDI